MNSIPKKELSRFILSDDVKMMRLVCKEWSQEWTVLGYLKIIATRPINYHQVNHEVIKGLNVSLFYSLEHITNSHSYVKRVLKEVYGDYKTHSNYLGLTDLLSSRYNETLFLKMTSNMIQIAEKSTKYEKVKIVVDIYNLALTTLQGRQYLCHRPSRIKNLLKEFIRLEKDLPSDTQFPDHIKETLMSLQ